MNNIIIDVKDKGCPLPLIALKKALKEYKDNFTLLVNDSTAQENTTRFLKENNINFTCKKNNGVFSINVGSTHNYQPSKNSQAKNIGNHVICIKSNKMGEGSDELGEILLRAFINNLKEVTPLPSALIFYNSGVKLTLKDSPVLDSLKDIASKNIKILVCGTCIDYYEVKDMVGVGLVSNMYEITETLTNAPQVIIP